MPKVQHTIDIIERHADGSVEWRCNICGHADTVAAGERVEHAHIPKNAITAKRCLDIISTHSHDNTYEHAMMQAEHQWVARVDVQELADSQDVIYTYAADVRVECSDCHAHMRFKGLTIGSSFTHPTTSYDGLVLRTPMEIVV